MRGDKISKPLVARLPRYYRCVEELYMDSCAMVTSATLSRRLGFTAAQIRHDFSQFGEFGQQGYGYNVKKLRYEIREILGLNSRNTAILVGCGNLGQALMKNFDFESCGFFLFCGFDTDPEKTGTEVNHVPIERMERLPRLVAAEQPSMAVLTAPRAVAPQVARQLADLGVPGIWNFTSCDLGLEDRDVLVERVDFAESLLTLSYRLNASRPPEK